jgi:predicted HTH domain antitoxin
MSTLTLTAITLSPTLEEEVAAVIDSGLYDNVETFLADAVRTLLAARPDLREAIACNLFARGVFSLGKAAEWSGHSIETMKAILHRRGIERGAFETPDEIQQMAHAILRQTGHTQS